MLKTLLLSALLALAALAIGESYLGVLTVRPESPYQMKNIEVTIAPNKTSNTANITLHHVKFSPMMPVRLTIVIPNVTMTAIEGGVQFSGNEIVPLKGGKPYASRKITHLSGKRIGSRISLSMTIGSAPVRYQGKSVEQGR